MHTQSPRGSYLLLQKVAKSAVSTVYLAKSSDPWHLGRVLALKRLRSDLRMDPSFVALYVQESRYAMRLLHENIVRTFELGRAGSDYYTAMEYVSGRSLHTVLRRALQVNMRFTEEMVLMLGVQVCDALAYAHAAARPMVHYDVCPSNLLVSFAGQVKVTNFGLAAAASVASRARAAFFRNHFAYLAPEQLRGAPLDGRVDLFALGAVLHEMLTLQPLLNGRTDASVVARLRAGHLPPARLLVAALSVDLEAVLLRALSPSPAGRYANAAAMGTALRDILQRRFGGGDPHVLGQAMSALFPRTLQREAVLWKRLVRAGWVPPQATAVVRWLGSGLGTPRLMPPQRPEPPPGLLGDDGLVLILASALAMAMVVLTFLLTR